MFVWLFIDGNRLGLFDAVACSGGNPMACQLFCSCIYDDGKPLNACLDEYQKARETEASLTIPPR